MSTHDGNGDQPSGAVLRTLLLTDLVSSTKLVEDLGDRRTFEVFGRHDEVARALLPGCGGREIDKTDGFLFLFDRPVDAVRYALAYHHALEELARELGVHLAARAGIHLGEVYLRTNPAEDVARGAKPIEVEGLAKPAAARIMSLGGSRQTLLTRGAFDLARRGARDTDLSELDLQWLDHGLYAFKGIDEPVRVFEVGVVGFAPLQPPPDSAKVHRVDERQAAHGEGKTPMSAGSGPSPRRVVAGDMLGRYRIMDLLGAGGMGEVFRARDTELDRDVAVKVLPEEVASDPDRLSRFRREARALAAVSHPNILEIFDFGSQDGVVFAVEELLEGEDLRAVLARGALDWRSALERAATIADGLAAAHAHGAVHRDIKPENIFVTTDQRIKILDFGLASVRRRVSPEAETLDVEPSLTGAGVVLGTLGYASPEQVRGQPADHRSDLFSLGCVMHEMVSGERPFRKPTAADTMAAILHEAPPELDARIGTEVPALAGLIGRCLEKEPDQRFQTAAELAGALRSLVSSPAVPLEGPAAETASPRPELVLSSPADAGSDPARWQRIGLGAGLALVVVVAVIAAVFLRTGQPEIGGPQPATGDPRIVVLPFENLGSEEDEYFAAGISDEITSRLAAVSRLRIVSPGPDHRATTDIDEVADELSVDYVLKGKVRWNRRRDGLQQVRITPQLIRVSDGDILWAHSFDRLLDDIFEVQSDIAGTVLTELNVTLLAGERSAIDSIPTSNIEAYQAYLRGLYYAQSIISEELLLAVKMFDRAVDLDPSFALAHAELAVTHSRLVSLRIDVSESRVAMAESAARRALELDPELARAHVGQAWYLAAGRRDREAALAELAIAHRQRPNDGQVLEWEAVFLLFEGRFREAEETFKQVLELDPTSYRAWVNLASALAVLRRHAEADAALQRAIEVYPDRLDAYLCRFWNALAWEGGTGLAKQVLDTVPEPLHRDVLELRLFALFVDRDFEGALELVPRLPAYGVESSNWKWSAELLECHAYHWLGRREEAQRACGQALAEAQASLAEYPRDPRLWATVGYSQAVLGNPDEAINAAEQALEFAAFRATDEIQFANDLVAISAIAGDTDRAIETLRLALSRPGWLTRAWLAVDWRYDNLRNDPRFQELAGEQPAP